MAVAVAVDTELMRAATLLDTDPAAAARAAAGILTSHPSHPGAMLLLGTARRRCGDADAIGILAELAASLPDSALLQLELGRTLSALGETDQAMGRLCRAVELEPDLAEAWEQLAMLHAARGETLACDRAHANFTRLHPPEQHLAEAAMALANGLLDTAESLLRKRLSVDSQDAEALRMRAVVAGEREDYVEAERLLAECLTLAPGYSRARFDLVQILHTQQKAAPMLPLLERLLAVEPDNLHYRSMEASAYGLLGQTERAIGILGGLLREHPGNELLWIYYGHAQRTAGRSADAIAAYRRSSELRPGFGGAWFCLANLKTFRFDTRDVETMRMQLVREDLTDNDRLQFEFALGKALEDAERYADAFAHYARGNALRRRSVRYDADRNLQLVLRTQATYTRQFFAERSGFGHPAPDPIFIVGLPRAGSTLLEQILASHSQVEGTRELPDVPGIALELGARELPGVTPAYPQSVAQLTRSDIRALGERYLQQTRPSRLRGAPWFIDKMPGNFFHVGLIQLILPRAKIIDARRSAMACCFSNFKQHFQSGVWFSYNLTDIGRFYADYVRLMDHFDEVLPGRVHHVQYEKLVSDAEDEVRRLLEYCELPFEGQCLRFHETQRVVQTASSEQVRRPLYSEAVDQWRHFEPYLDELKNSLGALAAPS